MIYDLSKPLDIRRFKVRCKQLIEQSKKVDLTQKRKRRTLNQNNYLHLILSWFGVETGYTLEEVKQDIFKRHICKDFFVIEKNSILVCKSTKELTTKELSQSIDKFRNWSSKDMNIYLPNANEKNMLDDIQSRLDSFKQYL